MKRPVNPELRVLRIIACEAIFGKVRQLSNTEAAARDRVAQEMADYAAKAVAESQARVTGLVATGQEATTPPLKSALNPLPKDNQIEALLIKYGDDCIDGKAVYTYKVEELLAALATAIRQSLPVKEIVQDEDDLAEQSSGNALGHELRENYVSFGHNAALDQFVEALRGLGLNL